METSNNLSEPRRNLELSPGNGDNTTENDFNFGSLVIETSAHMSRPPAPLGTPDEPTISQNIVEADIPIFYEIIPTLQEISSFVIAISLWRRVISLWRNSSFDYFDEIDDDEVEKLLLEVPAPRLIREMVKNYLVHVRNEMKRWLLYYKQNLFTSKLCIGESSLKMGDLLFCCWLPNGKIDHRASALNMLSNPRLTQVIKFKIICRYCLEDEMKTFSVESLPSNFTKRMNLGDNALMYYWICYKNDNLDEISIVGSQTIASYLITSKKLNSLSALEYFWDRLNVDEKSSKLETILDRRPEFQKYLFSKISEWQKFHLLSKIPVKIMENFWRQEGQEQFAISTWIYIRNFINQEQFKRMLRMLKSCTCSNIDEKVEYLVEIWNHCPDRLKELAFQRPFLDIITGYSRRGFHRGLYGNVRFLTFFFSFGSDEVRKKIIYERAHRILPIFDLSVTDQVIKSCLPNSDDELKFRQYILQSDFFRNDICEELCDNYYKMENRILDYYCPDSIGRIEFCSRVLQRIVDRRPLHKFDALIRIIDFIDENLLNAIPDRALKFKKQIFMSFSGFNSEFWSSSEKMAEIIEIVTQVLDIEELVEFKLKPPRQFEGYYPWHKFDESGIGKFLSWCFNNDDQKVREFKKTLSIDNICWYALNRIRVIDILQTEVEQETVREIFEPLDKALLWYFENPEDVKSFKLEKVFCCRDKSSRIFSASMLARNDAVMRNTLPWFFSQDRDAIELFREIFKHEAIGKMI